VEIARALIVLVAGVAGAAQNAVGRSTPLTPIDSGAEQQPYRERVDVSRIVVDARVVDRAGRAIEGLTAPDFAVTIDGKPAAVDSIDWVPAPAIERIDAPPPAFAAGVPWPRGRAIVLFYEKKSDLSEVAGLMRVRRDLASLRNIIAREDRVAIVSFDTRLHLWIDFTNDLSRIQQVLEHDIVVGSPPSLDPDSPGVLRARLPPTVQGAANTIEKSFRVLADALEPLPGRKSVIVLGYGAGTWRPRFGTVTMENDYLEALAALQKARVSVFCIDITTADYHPREEGLRIIARDTGGLYLRSHIFTTAVFDRLAGALAGYYALLVIPPNERTGERRIGVRLARRKGTVLANHRYVVE
jgi:VWFA-related protein